MTASRILSAYQMVAGRRCASSKSAALCDTHRSKWSLGTVGCDAIVIAAKRSMDLLLREHARQAG